MRKKFFCRFVIIILTVAAYLMISAAPADAYDKDAEKCLKKMFRYLSRGKPGKAFDSCYPKYKKGQDGYRTYKMTRSQAIMKLSKDKGARFKLLRGYTVKNRYMDTARFYFTIEKGGRKQIGCAVFAKYKGIKKCVFQNWNRYRNLKQACDVNLTGIKQALYMYKNTNGKFPASLGQLPGYQKGSVPRCPACGKDTYSSGYQQLDGGKKFQLKCTCKKH